jgi:hypothetical protein
MPRARAAWVSSPMFSTQCQELKKSFAVCLMMVFLVREFPGVLFAPARRHRHPAGRGNGWRPRQAARFIPE